MGKPNRRPTADGLEPDREAIMRRRNRLIGLALGGLASVAACGDSHTPPPGPCLQPDAAVDARARDAEPIACLSMAIDAGRDAGPTVCLEPPDPDAGVDAAPSVCLDLLPDAGT